MKIFSNDASRRARAFRDLNTGLEDAIAKFEEVERSTSRVLRDGVKIFREPIVAQAHKERAREVIARLQQACSDALSAIPGSGENG